MSKFTTSQSNDDCMNQLILVTMEQVGILDKLRPVNEDYAQHQKMRYR